MKKFVKEDSFDYRRFESEKESLNPIWIDFYSHFADRKGSELEFIEFNSELDTLSFPNNYPFSRNKIKFHYDADLQIKGFDKPYLF